MVDVCGLVLRDAHAPSVQPVLTHIAGQVEEALVVGLLAQAEALSANRGRLLLSALGRLDCLHHLFHRLLRRLRLLCLLCLPVRVAPVRTLPFAVVVGGAGWWGG